MKNQEWKVDREQERKSMILLYTKLSRTSETIQRSDVGR